ncbi:MAG: hypothetical protein D6729_03905 [Deltaproteobacteria bacterium]|nr:MAG: hypothetical protein D6729_03905 [Deltaproteobacteria bacterium]
MEPPTVLDAPVPALPDEGVGTERARAEGNSGGGTGAEDPFRAALKHLEEVEASGDATVRVRALPEAGIEEAEEAREEGSGEATAPALRLETTLPEGTPPPASLPAPSEGILRQIEAIRSADLDGPSRIEALLALERATRASADRAAVHRALSTAYEAEGDRDRAFFSLVRAARLVPPKRADVDELFRLAVLTGAYQELSAVYEDALQGALPPADRIYLHLKLGHLYGRELAKPSMAARHYQRVLDLDASSVEALRRLAEIYAREKRWDRVAEVKERELAAVWRTTHSIEEAAAVKRELARIYEEELGDRATALVHYRELLDLTPGNAAAIEHLERLGETRDSKGTDITAREAFETLRDLYQRQGAYRRLADHLSEGARTALRENRILDAVDLHHEAALVLTEHLEDPGRAFIELVRALQVLPQGEAAEADGLDLAEVEKRTDLLVERLFETGRASNSHAQLQAVTEDLALRIGGERGATILVKIAEVDLEDLGEAGRAASRLARAVELSGNDPAMEARLEGLYVSRGAWRELAEFYRARADRLREVEARNETLFRLAEILEDEIGDTEGAIRIYEEIIETSGGNVDALRALMRLHEAAKDWRALVATLERSVHVASDIEEKKAALLHRAQVNLEKLQDTQAARDDWQRVLALDPGCVEALQGLADTAEGEGDARETTRALEASLAEMRPGTPGRLDAYRRLARLYGDHLQQLARARLAWEEVLREAPDDDEAFARLRTLYRKKEDLPALVELLRARIERAKRHPDARLWRRELIEALEALGRGDEVGEAWWYAKEADPTDEEAHEQLVAFHTARRNWDVVVRVLREWIDIVPRERKADLYFRLAQVLQHECDREEEALAAYEKGLSLSDGHPRIEEALLELYRKREALDKAFPLLHRRLSRLSDPTSRGAALEEVWQIGSRLAAEGDQDAGERALEALKEACLLRPADDSLWDALEDALSSAADAQELAGFFEARAARLEGAQRAASLLKAAEYLRKSGDPEDPFQRDRIRRCLERARDAAPTDHPISARVLGLLRAHYTAAGAWEALAGVLERLANEELTPDPVARATIMEELAQILETHCGRPQEAELWMERLVALPQAPSRKKFLRHLARLEAELGEWEKVLRRVEDLVGLAEDAEEEATLRLEAVDIAEQRLDDPERAVAHLRALLALRPGDEGLLHRLERVCGGSRRFAELYTVLSEEAARTTDAEARADLLVRAALIQEEQLGDLQGARRDLERVLESPGTPPRLREAAQGGLIRILSRTGAAEDLARLYEAMVREETIPEKRSDLHLSLGLILEEQLADPRGAMASYQAALADDPGNTAALDAVARLAEAAGDFEEALECRTRHAELARTPELAARLHFDRGRLLESLGREGEALAAYNAAAEKDPNAAAPRRAALRLMRQRQEDEAFLVLARQLARITDDPTEEAMLWTEIGERLLEAGDNAAARGALEAALAAHPDFPPAAAHLGGLLLAAGDAERALSLLARAAGRLSPERDRDLLAEVLWQAASAADRLGRAELSLRYLNEAWRLGPQRASTLAGLAEALCQRGEYDRAYEAFRTLLDLHGEEMPARERGELMRRIGECLIHMDRPGDAAGTLQRAVEADPHNRSAIVTLCRLFEETGRWGEAIEYKRRLLRLTRDPKERRAIALEMAEIFSAKLHDAPRAARTLAALEKEHPGDVEILSRLAREQEKQGAFSEAAETLEAVVAALPPSEERLEALLRIGVLKRDRLEDAEGAVAAFRRVLEESGSPPLLDAALTGVRDLVALTRDARPLAQMLRWLAESDRSWPSKTEVLRELAEVLRYQMDDRRGAIEVLEQVRRLDPDDLKAVEDLARLYEKVGEDGRAMEAWRQVLATSPFDVDAYRALIRLSQRSGNLDGAAVVASLLVLLEEADLEEQRLARMLESAGPPRDVMSTKARLSRLTHPHTRGPEGGLIAVLGTEGAALFAPSGRAARERSGGPFSSDAGPAADQVAEALLTTVRTLAIPAADVHLGLPGQEEVFRAQIASRPLLTVAPEIVLGTRRIAPELLRFHAARALIGVLPAWYPARVLDLPQLKALLDAAAVAAGHAGKLPLPPTPEVTTLAKKLERSLPDSKLKQLGPAALAYVSSLETVDLRRFAEAVEHTAVRAGLLLAGTPQRAVEALRAEGEVSRVTLRELVRFALAPDHLLLRKELGVALSGGA